MGKTYRATDIHAREKRVVSELAARRFIRPTLKRSPAHRDRRAWHRTLSGATALEVLP